MTARRFILRRDTDETGVSGAGDVAEGVEFSDGVIALRWTTAWPTSVVFHDRGLESVRAVHGHGGKSRVVWLDEEDTTPAGEAALRRGGGALLGDAGARP